MTSKTLKAVELFAGIGGFRLGMEAANIQTIWANDLSELASQVYQSNFGETSIVFRGYSARLIYQKFPIMTC